jgi:hypothetical protein
MSASSRALQRGRLLPSVRAPSGTVTPSAMIAPVEVPAIRSNSSHAGRSLRRSISARTSAGMIPRIPPPSIERIFTSCWSGTVAEDTAQHGGRTSKACSTTAVSTAVRSAALASALG